MELRPSYVIGKSYNIGLDLWLNNNSDCLSYHKVLLSQNVKNMRVNCVNIMSLRMTRIARYQIVETQSKFKLWSS